MESIAPKIKKLLYESEQNKERGKIGLVQITEKKEIFLLFR